MITEKEEIKLDHKFIIGDEVEILTPIHRVDGLSYAEIYDHAIITDVYNCRNGGQIVGISFPMMAKKRLPMGDIVITNNKVMRLVNRR